MIARGDGGCGMKEALIVIVAVAFGVYVTAKRFQHRFKWFGSATPRGKSH